MLSAPTFCSLASEFSFTLPCYAAFFLSALVWCSCQSPSALSTDPLALLTNALEREAGVIRFEARRVANLPTKELFGTSDEWFELNELGGQGAAVVDDELVVHCPHSRLFTGEFVELRIRLDGVTSTSNSWGCTTVNSPRADAEGVVCLLTAGREVVVEFDLIRAGDAIGPRDYRGRVALGDVVLKLAKRLLAQSEE